MPPANVVYILVCSALTAHVRRGSDNAFSTRLYGKYFAEEHTFILPEQPLYTPTQVFLDALRVVNRAYSRLTLAATSLQEAPVGAAMGCPLSV